MKAMVSKKANQRILAAIMACVMLFSLIYTSSPSAAETETHKNCITVSVVDEDGKAVEGARVEYSISSKQEGKVKSDIATTDGSGVVEVFSTTEYEKYPEGDLSVSAEVTKTGYEGAVLAGDVTSDTHDFQMTIKENKITGVVIKPNDLKYNGSAQELVSVTGTKEGDKVSYKLGDGEFSTEVPKATEMGTYNVSVKVERGGYPAYEENVRVTIADGVFTDDDIIFEAYSGDYDGVAHASVTKTGGKLDDGKNTITYEYDGKTYNEAPAFIGAGEYSVKVVVKREHYEQYEETLTAKINSVAINGITVEPKTGLKYTGSPQALVTVSGVPGDATVKYEVTDHNGNKSNENKGTEVDTYSVKVTVVSNNKNYKDLELKPVTVAIAKAERTIKFKNKEYDNTDVLKVEFDSTNIATPIDPEKANYDFSVEASPVDGGKISYKVENNVKGEDSNNIGDIASIKDDGELKINKGGYIIKVTATIEATDHYEEASITKEVVIKEKSLPVLTVNCDSTYVLGTNNGVIATIEKNENDNGKIALTTEGTDKKEIGGIELVNDPNEGYIINVKGDAYKSLIGKLEKAENNELSVTLQAKQSEGKKTSASAGNTEYVVYSATEQPVTKTVTIKFADVPNDKKITDLYEIDGEKTDENSNWYTGDVTVTANETYNLSKYDENDLDFKSSIEYDAEVKDKVYKMVLKNNDGGILKPAQITLNIDKFAPEVSNVEFIEEIPLQSSTSLANNIIDAIIYHYYGGSGEGKPVPVKVKVKATDSVSGISIEGFKWECEYTDQGTLKTIYGIVEKGQYSKDKDNEYYLIIDVPKEFVDKQVNEVNNASIAICATDNAGNVSGYTSNDGDRFVYDTIAPEINVGYDLANLKNKSNGIEYFAGDIIFTVTVTEANFDQNDLKIKDNNDTIHPGWNEEINNQCTFKLEANGKHIVNISYTDKSGNPVSYSRTIIIDKTDPEIEFTYGASNKGEVKKHKDSSTRYYNGSMEVTCTITEDNFDKNNTVVKVNAKEVDKDTVGWNKVKDENGKVAYKASIPIQAEKNTNKSYLVEVNTTDMCSNNNSKTSDEIIIDTKKPSVSVLYDGKAESTYRNESITISIDEDNYNDVNTTVVLQGVDFNNSNKKDAQKDYVVNEETTGGFTLNNGKYTKKIEIEKDANYTLTVDTKDRAGNSNSEDNKSWTFVRDTTAPTDLNISYSNNTINTDDKTNYYNNTMTVTLTATDVTSGVEEFIYTAHKTSGASGINKETYSDKISGTAIARKNGNEFTGSFEISAQFDGYIEFSAKDKAGNPAASKTDTKRIVVDNKAPTSSVTFNTPVQNVGGTSYYDGNITATININEANFNAGKITVSVTKDGVNYPVSTSWSGSGDSHTGIVTLSEDGDYNVSISGTDEANNSMTTYTSENLTIDTDITEPVITVNGLEADGKAFKDKVIPAVKFEDTNLDSYEITLLRTRYGEKNVDVTKDFIKNHMSVNMGTGVGEGEFDEFAKVQDNDGIYTLKAKITDKAGHESEKQIVFTVNRYGSIYVYDDYLVDLIADGGAYVQSIDKDLIITEYNPDKLVSQSLNVEISKDGKPLEIAAPAISPEINDRVTTGSSGWYQYQYTISKDNFAADGIYKIVVSSKDETGNNPQNTNYEDKTILFRVDSTAPEINSITGLENRIINATGVTVKYTIFDTISLASVDVYVNGEKVESVSDFGDDFNNYSGEVQLKESSSEQSVRIVATDKAGNVTDTDSSDFTSAYKFNSKVTVSTNVFVRWFANKLLFFGSIAGVLILIGGVSFLIVLGKKRKKKTA